LKRVVLLGSYPQVAIYRLVDVALACQEGFERLPGSERDLIENGP